MWCYGIIKKGTYEVIEEGYFFKEDAERDAAELGDDYVVEEMPL